MNKIKFSLLVLIFSISIKAQVIEKDLALNLKNLYLEIIKDSIKFPNIVLKQAIAETGWLKSIACKERNNLFGFNNGVSKFKTWQDAVKSYKKWQDKNYKGGSYDSFLIRIKYAKDGNAYIKFLNKIKIPDYIYVL